MTACPCTVTAALHATTARLRTVTAALYAMTACPRTVTAVLYATTACLHTVTAALHARTACRHAMIVRSHSPARLAPSFTVGFNTASPHAPISGENEMGRGKCQTDPENEFPPM